MVRISTRNGSTVWPRKTCQRSILSGNGIVIVSGRLLLRRTGEPNRYPESQRTKYVYRGATSLVPRVFLCRSEYPSVSAIKEEIEARGTSVALSTVSKVFTRMAEDVLIDRTDLRITLLQPDALLETLRDNFPMPRSQREVRVKVRGRLSILFKRAGRDQGRPRLVLSGASSQDRYDSGIRSDKLRVYCAHLRDVSKRVGESWEESERFADLTVVETGDRTPFFDTRCARDSVAHASLVQACLELANQIRESIRPLAPLVPSDTGLLLTTRANGVGHSGPRERASEGVWGKRVRRGRVDRARYSLSLNRDTRRP